MASTANAFALLDDEGFKQAKKKGKKKQKAPGQAAAPAEQPEIVPYEEEPQHDDADFKPAQHIVKARASARPSADREVPVQKASDLSAALEREAAAAAGSGRAALAASWAAKAHQPGPKYADGTRQLDFKQVLAKSQALDTLVEGYLGGCSAADAEPLAALLAVVAAPSAPADLPVSLATAVAGLGQLASSDPLSVSAAARRSVAAALALLKAGLPDAKAAAAGKGEAAPAAQLSGLAGKLEKLEAQLPRTTTLREQVRLWGEIFSTTQQKLDVVGMAGGGRPTPQVAAVLGPLESLHRTLEGRIKEVHRAKSGATIEAQLARAEASYKQEDAATQARLAEVEGRVKALEAELAGLRQEAQQLAERRGWAAQHHQQLCEKIKSGATNSAQAEADLEAGLRAVDALRAALEGATAGPSQDAASLAQQLVEKEVPGKFVGSVQQVVELGLKLLHEMAGKAQFYRDRLAQAVRQGEHLALLKLNDSKQQEEHAKQTGTLRKMLQDVLSSAEGVSQSVAEAARAYRERVGLLLTLPSFPAPPPEFSAHLEAMVAQASHMLHSIVSEQAQAPSSRGSREPSRSTSPEKEKPPRAGTPARERSGTAAPSAAAAPPAVTTPAAAPPLAAAPALTPAAAGQSAELVALEHRLAALEEQNRQKDAQIAALLSSATVEVPSPLPAALGSPAAAALAAVAPPQAPHFASPLCPVPAAPSLFAQPAVELAVPLDAAPVVPLPVPISQGLGGEPVPLSAPPAQAPKIASFAQALAAGRGRGARA